MTDKIPCPVCGGESAKPVVKDGEPEIMRCVECGFMFACPYSLQYSSKCLGCAHKCYKPGPTQKARLSVEEKRLAYIECLCGPLKGLKVLELGAGAGHTAALAIRAGADYEGLEPIQDLCEKSAALFPETRGKIRPLFPQKAGLREKSYDLIIASNFLQYIPRPAAFAGYLAALLKNGGRLYLEVPNEKFLHARIFIRRALRLYPGATHPGNINFFSPASLDRTLEEGGFTAASSGQLTLIGDPARLEATLCSPPGAVFRALAAAAAAARLDLILQQGSLFRLCTVRPLNANDELKTRYP